MPLSCSHLGSLCRRVLAICAVGILSITLGPSSAHATCGDYLSSHGEGQHAKITHQQVREFLAGRELPFAPHHCPNGDCRSQNEAPVPSGATTQSRTTDDVRSFGWLSALQAEKQNSRGGRTAPADEPLPDAPFLTGLERPPQSTSV